MNPIIFVHVIAASTALALGPLVFLNPKGTPRHRLLGRVLASALVLTALSGFGIYEFNNGYPSVFHGLAVMTLLTVFFGIRSILRFKQSRSPADMAGHYYRMAYGYMGLVMGGWAQGLGELPISWTSYPQYYSILFGGFAAIWLTARWLIGTRMRPLIEARYFPQAV